jgi:hypothetical protein
VCKITDSRSKQKSVAFNLSTVKENQDSTNRERRNAERQPKGQIAPLRCLIATVSKLLDPNGDHANAAADNDELYQKEARNDERMFHRNNPSI